MMIRSDFNDLIHRCYRKLYSVAFRIVRNQQEAEDVVQNVFVRMWTMGEKLDDYNDPEALAVTMTRNSCIDLLRKMKYIGPDTPINETIVSGFAPSPHEELVRSETNSILTDIINNLPSHYREIIILKEFDGLSYEEISKLKNMNINSLRVNLSRARSMIKDEFNRQTYERREADRTA